MEVAAALAPDSTVSIVRAMLGPSVRPDAVEAAIELDHLGPPLADLSLAHVSVAILDIAQQTAERIAIVLASIADQGDSLAGFQHPLHRARGLPPTALLASEDLRGVDPDQANVGPTAVETDFDRIAIDYSVDPGALSVVATVGATVAASSTTASTAATGTRKLFARLAVAIGVQIVRILARAVVLEETLRLASVVEIRAVAIRRLGRWHCASQHRGCRDQGRE